MRLKVLGLPIALILMVSALSARAVPINHLGLLGLDPLDMGLAPGDEFRLAFVTAGTRDASSANISDYNAFVTGEAGLTGSLTEQLSLTWTAIASTEEVDARDNAGTNPTIEAGVPIFRLDGQIVAISNSDLWDGSIANPINVEQDGTLRAGGQTVWTGTHVEGIALQSNFLGELRAGEGVLFGTSNRSDIGWTEAATGSAFDLHHFYALSEALVVPVSIPEPTAITLFGIGLAGLGYARRRRKQA